MQRGEDTMKEAMPGIIGNAELKKRLSDDILEGTLPHAIILEGKRGSGKYTIARLCAAALACEKKKDSRAALPCLECSTCRKIMEKKSPDVIVIGSEGKTSIGVETIRFLREDVHVIPNDLDYKVYLIEDADRMTVQAQNAFLLTLEEPPAFVRFFLLTENAGSLLETIRSRAPILRTETLSPEEIDTWLSSHDRRAAQMKLSSPKDYAELIKASGSGIGQALDFLDPKVFAPVLECRRLAADFVSAAVRGNGADSVLTVLNRFSTKRDRLSEQLNMVSDALRDLILLKKSEDPALIFYSSAEEAVELCDLVSLQVLYRLQISVSEALKRNERNANVRLLLLQIAADAGLIP